MSIKHALSILLLLSFLTECISWHRWATASEPGARRGHSIQFYNSQLILFGGRGEDINVTHIPKTFDLIEVNGTLSFATYDEKVVSKTTPTSVQTGRYFNDVWSYDINCTRYAGDGCVNGTWKRLTAAVSWGGFYLEQGSQHFSYPSERWYHQAQVFPDNTMLIYGGFGPLCHDYCDDMWLFHFSNKSWTRVESPKSDENGPGKRFKFSSAVSGFQMYVFGGYRLWHGFAGANSEANDWADTTQYPAGGYLNDLWVYDKPANRWSNITEELVCLDPASIGEAVVDAMGEVECTLVWPPGRAGHTSVIHNDAIYIHGGYRTFFPYPTTTSVGAGRGRTTGSGARFKPYPTHPYFLNDFWSYNLTTRQWNQILPRYRGDRKMDFEDGEIPEARMGHSMVAMRDIFVLFGGYSTNYHFDDTWQYFVSSNRWSKRKAFVYAKYIASCTDDLWARKQSHSGMYDAYIPPADLSKDGFFSKELFYGTKTFSVFAEPTRGSKAEPLLIPQARRQAPGWDGCRDRDDGRKDLPQTLQWEHPSQRSGHASAYHPAFDAMFLYGGGGYMREEKYHSLFTPEERSQSDFWLYKPTECIKNCSLHGACNYGSCQCEDGYYGTDCSNTSCPGTYCSYDENLVETCDHCCFSTNYPTESDVYVEGVQKYPCTSENAHYSHGICDGFGKCICEPGFVGEDCSIRDCQNDCSGNGYCSIEFPNARCMCDIGWYGMYCEKRFCLNNCSYPNGVCVNGSCYCSMTYDPYNNTWEYFPLMGEDCSFALPYARAEEERPADILWVLTLLALWLL